MKECHIRAHHVMCLAFFEGKGYSSEFTANMTAVKQRLEENPPVCVVQKADEICACCPNHTKDGCLTGEKVDRYDSRVLSLCGLKSGDRLRWQSLKQLVRDKILDAGEREGICGDCQWNEICRKRWPVCQKSF